MSITKKSTIRELATVNNGARVTWMLAHFDDQYDKIPKLKSYSWDNFKVLFSLHNPKPKAKAPRFSLTQYATGATRGNEGIEAMTGAAIDIDDGTPFEVIRKRLDTLQLGYIAFSTTQHTPEFPRYRVIILFQSQITPEQWPTAFDKINHHIFDGKADPSYRTDLQHLSNLPNCPKENKKDAFVVAHDGATLDPDDLPTAPQPTPPTQPTNTSNGHRPIMDFSSTSNRDGRGSAYADKVLSGELGKLRAAPDGTRNTILNKVSFTLGQWTAGGMFDRPNIESMLKGTALEIGMKLTEDGILKTIKSGLDQGSKDPKTLPLPPNSYQGAATLHPANQLETTETTGYKPTITLGFPLNDIGNGQRFALMHGHRARYCSTRKSWSGNNGQRWVNDEGNEIDLLAKITARTIANEAAEEQNDDKRTRILKHALASCTRKSRKNMIEDAISEPGMSIKATEFDTDPYLFNVENGTLDLRTGALKPHNPDDLITKMGNVTHDATAQCPLFLDFLSKTFEGDKDLIESMQRALGYSLTGDTREQSFFIGHGGGSNGKSTLLQAIKRVMGDYAIEVEPATIMRQTHEKMATDIADLHNIRLVITSESSGTQRLDEAKIKKMTGGEDLTGERKFEHPFKFKPQFKLFLATNHLPQIGDTGHSIWRRVVTVPFYTTFWKEGEGDPGMPELKADPDFPKKLDTESSGILNWLLAGCLQWQQSGLTYPIAVQKMKAEYRQDQDVLSDFLETHCTLGPGFYDTAKRIYERYCLWCDTEGVKPISSTMFGKKLKEKGLQSQRKTAGNQWLGITLKDAPKDTPKELPM